MSDFFKNEKLRIAVKEVLSEILASEGGLSFSERTEKFGYVSNKLVQKLLHQGNKFSYQPFHA